MQVTIGTRNWRKCSACWPKTLRRRQIFRGRRVAQVAMYQDVCAQDTLGSEAQSAFLCERRSRVSGCSICHGTHRKLDGRLRGQGGM